MKRQAAAVFEQCDHGRGGFVVLRLAHPRWRRGGKHLAAQPAAQPLQLIDLRLQGRDPGDAHQDRGLLTLNVDPPGTPWFGAGIAVLEAGVRDRNAWGAGIVRGAVAAMTLTRLLGRGVPAGRGLARAARVGSSVRRGGALGGVFAQDLVGGLGAETEEQVAYPLQGGGLDLQLLGDTRQGVHRGLEDGVLVLRQGFATGALDDGVEPLDGDRHPLGGLVLAPAHAPTPRQRRKSACSGNPSTSLRERLGRWVKSSLPRPVVRPRTCQLAAR